MTNGTEDSAIVFRHSPGRWFILGIFGFMAIIGTSGLVASATGGGPPSLFIAVWLLGLAFGAYLWLIRVAMVLRLEADDSLVASASLRTRRVPLSAITRIRPSRLGSNLTVIEHNQGWALMVIMGRGIQGFFDELGRRRPDLDVRLSQSRASRASTYGVDRWRQVSGPPVNR